MRLVYGFYGYRIFAILLTGNRILSILLPGTKDTVFNILVDFRDIEYLGKLIMGIFASIRV